jgi:hypothetical protein
MKKSKDIFETKHIHHTNGKVALTYQTKNGSLINKAVLRDDSGDIISECNFYHKPDRTPEIVFAIVAILGLIAI